MRYWFYRWFMRFAHRHNWHHMDVFHPDGDTQHWCQWCGIRVTLKRDHFGGAKIVEDPSHPRNSITLVNLRG